jgi:hypothetical protein
VGTSQPPNNFWADDPARSDSVLIDLIFPRADVQNRVIISTSEQEQVNGKVNESNFTGGLRTCISGAGERGTTGEHCAGIMYLGVQVTAQGQDPNTGATYFRGVRHQTCTEEGTLVLGDSGAPVYTYISGADGPVRAMGIASSGNASRDCFSSMSRLADLTGTHLWLD